MKLPRDLSGPDLAKALRKMGYEVTRQTGSHMRLTTSRGGEHHVTIPPPATLLRVGTPAAILDHVTQHFQIPRHKLYPGYFRLNRPGDGVEDLLE